MIAVGEEGQPFLDIDKISNARILIIDHHDSYTLNLLIILIQATKCTSSHLLSRTVVLPHNHPFLASINLFKQHLLPHFDALILGPGPGHPSNEKDFGPAKRILNAILEGDIQLPTLGLCLGHQGIVVACGGKVIQAGSLRHGLISKVYIPAENEIEGLALPSVFQSVSDTDMKSSLNMIRYNSLTVDESSLPSDLIVTAWSHDPTCSAPPPKKNNYSPNYLASNSSTLEKSTSRVVMGIQHKTLPLWGIQFHPESVSSQGGQKIIAQFLKNCRQYWLPELSRSGSTKRGDWAERKVQSWDRDTVLPDSIQALGNPLIARSSVSTAAPPQQHQFKVVTHPIKGASPSYTKSPSIFETVFGDSERERASIWLDSSRSGDPQSRFSYMSRPSWNICYDAFQRVASVVVPGSTEISTIATFSMDASTKGRGNDVNIVHGLVTPKASRCNSPENEKEVSQDFWTWLSSLQELFRTSCLYQNEDVCPFKTGFVGYFDYEMKKESLTRGGSRRSPAQLGSEKDEIGLPSAWFGFCDRILVYDHHASEWRAVFLLRLDEKEDDLEEDALSSIQRNLVKQGIKIGLSENDASTWIAEIERKLRDAVDSVEEEKVKIETSPLPPLSPLDSASTYKAKVEAARDYICKGESYEICLTNRFLGQLSREKSHDGYDIYKALRKKNPAPYSAFINVGKGKSILSTSPERFMSIEADGQVEMRPIKGTLARAGYKEGEEEFREGKRRGDKEMTRWCQEEDERRRKALECDPKERAENLMIVDLIRADLLSFCAPDTVQVPSLMQVESYESVHQLVTTILGQKNSSIGSVQALKRCFPPGSMTGAPKVRSVEILDKLESRPRGIYSGILGWLGMDGAASFSVIIRTIVVEGRNVSVGAGGAITYLSDAEKEWQEVLDKVSSIARVQS